MKFRAILIEIKLFSTIEEVNSTNVMYFAISGFEPGGTSPFMHYSQLILLNEKSVDLYFCKRLSYLRFSTESGEISLIIIAVHFFVLLCFWPERKQATKNL